ncbi:hypothetical protein GCM10010401_18840 [Rarobacter faecitabidus]|uniref:Uncharacterized protein n=1 Tax=Rarobacter faecitabidus TaxID=13243 RepID=A0A542ZUR4_RARFA|nr:hypothetical protein [Rarobacter faecitabidus]TQL64094.1 hypothetical protein FB461_0579 [Rarobacter faecitabidus]
MAKTEHPRRDDGVLPEQPTEPVQRGTTLAFLIAVTLIVVASVAAILVALMSYRSASGLGGSEPLGLERTAIVVDLLG